MNQMAMMMQNQGMGNNNQAQNQTSNGTDSSNTANQPQSQKKEENPTGMSIIFRASGAGGEQNRPPITIQCLGDEKVADIIKKYRIKADDKDESKKFIFNAKALNVTLTVAEAGLTNNANIFVVTTKGVKGAY